MAEMMSKQREVSSDVLKGSVLGFSLFEIEIFLHSMDGITDSRHIKPEAENKLRDCNTSYDRIRTWRPPPPQLYHQLD